MEICFFYTESFTCPSRAREVFRQMKEMGAATVMFNIYEQDLSRWPKDVPHRLWTEEATMTTLMLERMS